MGKEDDLSAKSGIFFLLYFVRRGRCLYSTTAVSLTTGASAPKVLREARGMRCFCVRQRERRSACVRHTFVAFALFFSTLPVTLNSSPALFAPSVPLEEREPDGAPARRKHLFFATFPALSLSLFFFSEATTATTSPGQPAIACVIRQSSSSSSQASAAALRPATQGMRTRNQRTSGAGQKSCGPRRSRRLGSTADATQPQSHQGSAIKKKVTCPPPPSTAAPLFSLSLSSRSLARVNQRAAVHCRTLPQPPPLRSQHAPVSEPGRAGAVPRRRARPRLDAGPCPGHAGAARRLALRAEGALLVRPGRVQCAPAPATNPQRH